MKQKLLLFLSLIICSIALTQDYYKQGSFVIKGQVKNSNSNLIDVGIEGYLGSSGLTIVINPDGSYEHQFPVQHRQDLIILLNDSFPIRITIENDDTVFLNWDNKNLKNSLVISGKNESRTKELQVQLMVETEYWQPYIDLNEKVNSPRNTLTSETKFNLTSELYNQHVKAIIDKSRGFVSEGLNYYITGIYFRYTNFLYLNRLIPKFKLQLDSISANADLIDRFLDLDYETLSENWFWNIPEYRLFIENYVSFFQPFKTVTYLPNSKTKGVNPILDNYYGALSNIEIINIQEWFIANAIIRGFASYEFTGVEKTYEQFINKSTIPYLKDTLRKYYTAISKLKPRNPAPGFTLRNERGEKVSLSDLKGKVVYIDFWGVYCGPCIYEIEGYATKLHEQYKNKDVAFINICVDSKESTWKNALNKYQLKGINLIAEGWTNNPVCQDYNINGLPHYVLINKDGVIVDNNAPRPSGFDLKSGNNPIDRLLK